MDRTWESRIPVSNGRTRPFLLRRSWSGPAGHYHEQWVLTKDKTPVHQSEPKEIFVRGMQARSEYVDLVTEDIPLEPGDYELVFIVEGRLMGTAPVKAAPD